MKLKIKLQKWSKVSYTQFITSRHYFCLKGFMYLNKTEIGNLIIYKR